MIKQRMRAGTSGMLGTQNEELVTSQFKNTVSEVKPLVKNGKVLKAHGFHLSNSRGDDRPGQVTAKPLFEGPAPTEAVPVRSTPQPKESEDICSRRPLKLAPLELSSEVKEAQLQKIKGIQLEANMATQKLAATIDEPYPRKGKNQTKEDFDTSAGMFKSSHLKETPLAQTPLNTARSIRAAPAPIIQDERKSILPCKPLIPKLAIAKHEAQEQCSRDSSKHCENPNLLHTSGRRRLRSKQGKGLEEDYGSKGSNVSKNKSMTAYHFKPLLDMVFRFLYTVSHSSIGKVLATRPSSETN
ncbi:uncharacterized protein LOC121315183 [Polyodon spathula]|uniref:uncharacterized protein LOC121315183 n=1 Tax=Polyodon spathula TaxID=7913 RepID=UPI001B7DA036|nr:uncharacterized protein LOC121315183 [Polyodon spathula]